MKQRLIIRANLPVFEALYKSVKDGSETRRSLEFNSRKTYREDLQKELTEIDNQEIWRAGKTVRALRVSFDTTDSTDFSPMPTRTSFKHGVDLLMHRDLIVDLVVESHCRAVC